MTLALLYFRALAVGVLEKPRLVVAGGLALSVAAVLFAEYWLRCHGKPLARAEALERAQARLQGLSRRWALGQPLPSLAQEQYDSTNGSWA